MLLSKKRGSKSPSHMIPFLQIYMEWDKSNPTCGMNEAQFKKNE